MVRAILSVVAGLLPVVAFADPVWPVSPNLGVIEVLAEPGGDHLGVYPYVAASMLFPAGNVAIIPAVGVEWSPEFDRWGFVGSVTFDHAMSAHIGFDVNLAFIHDQQDHHWDNAIFLAGGGPGVSIFLGKLTVSPYVSYFRGLNVEGGAIVPGGLNLALAL